MAPDFILGTTSAVTGPSATSGTARIATSTPPMTSSVGTTSRPASCTRRLPASPFSQ